MICRSELKRLQGLEEYPSVSLLAPTHRTAPAMQKDRVVVKNLAGRGAGAAPWRVQEAGSGPAGPESGQARRSGGLGARARRPRPLRESGCRDGDPAAVPREAAAGRDATFATRDLVFALNRSPHYRVLVLTEKPTRLFDATTTVLTEVTTGPFPMVHAGPGGASRLPGGRGINPSAVRDESHRKFFRKVDAVLAAIQKEEHLPVVLVGVERYLAFYQEVTKDPDAIVGAVTGSHDAPNPSSLGKLVWPVFKAGNTLRRTRALARLHQAVSLNRHASGIDQVWRAAFEKRCQTLLVETTFEHPADVSSHGRPAAPLHRPGAGGPGRRR